MRNFPNRVQRAYAAANFSRVTQRDDKGFPVEVETVGSLAAHYRVKIDRWEIKDGIVHVSCRKIGDEVSSGGTCEGCKAGVCYHSIAAVIVAVSTSDKKIAITDSESKAKTLKNLGGNLFKIVSELDKKIERPVYIVVSGK